MYTHNTDELYHLFHRVDFSQHTCTFRSRVSEPSWWLSASSTCTMADWWRSQFCGEKNIQMFELTKKGKEKKSKLLSLFEAVLFFWKWNMYYYKKFVIFSIEAEKTAQKTVRK